MGGGEKFVACIIPKSREIRKRHETAKWNPTQKKKQWREVKATDGRVNGPEMPDEEADGIEASNQSVARN
jgi:hypothetical protein